MGQQIEDLAFDADAPENCPECSHSWKDDGPAHFPDCRYFCLDDDRDEEPLRLYRGKVETEDSSPASLR
jgi:hypothetical protein